MVAHDHPIASRTRATLEDVADYGAFELEPPFPQPLRDAVLPARAPSGRPIHREPVDRLTHVLTLVGHCSRVHASVVGVQHVLARPGLAFVPIPELPALSAGLVWCAAAESATIRAFSQVSAEARQGAVVG